MTNSTPFSWLADAEDALRHMDGKLVDYGTGGEAVKVGNYLIALQADGNGYTIVHAATDDIVRDNVAGENLVEVVASLP